MGYFGYVPSGPHGYYPHAVVSSFFSMLCLIISFSSPYWLASDNVRNSEFIRLGLWTACFRQYRHHNHQFDQKFDGCHWIFGDRFRNIKNWLQPEWMVFVQTAMSCSVLFSVIAVLLLLALPVLSGNQFRRCLCVLATAFILESLTGLSTPHLSLSQSPQSASELGDRERRRWRSLVMANWCSLLFRALLGFLSVSVFGGMCFDRSWMPHSNHNYLSWSYILAAVSCLLHGAVAAIILYVTHHVRNARLF